MDKPKEYHIKTIEDLLEIPEHKIDEVLKEIKDYLPIRREFEQSLGELPEQIQCLVRTEHKGIIWVDDGVEGITGVRVGIKLEEDEAAEE